jgi:hypothetical protein
MSLARRYWREIGLLFLLLVYILLGRLQAHEYEPPMLLLVEQETVVYGPAGERIYIPAGAEIDVCAGDGMLLVYELAPMVVRVPQPCTERPLFRDGFEL